MRVLWNNIKPVVALFFAWRLLLIVVEGIAPKLFPLREGFLGPIPWANFDGVHYLSIAQAGYRQYLEAFFPLYPLLIHWLSNFFSIAPSYMGLIISHISTFITIILFYKLVLLYDKKKPLWSTALFLLFPSSFFLVATYSDGLYLFLASLTFLFIFKHKWWQAGIVGFFASATRLFGVYLLLAALYEYFSTQKRVRPGDIVAIGLIPLGLVFYMIYLWRSMGDPLAFFHVQPVFGANRSGSEFILLPQVIWRYVKILISVPSTTFLYQIATLEFISFVFSIILIVKAWQWKLNRSYILYSALVIITPTLTGTLSSFPRYMLSAFPLFLVVGKFPLLLRIILAIVSAASLIYFASAFLRGYFVA